MRRLFQTIVAGLFLASLAGCTLLDLRTQDERIGRTGFVAVEVTSPPGSVPVYAMAVSSSGKVVGAERVGTDRFATFALPKSETFTVLVFADANRNRRFDVGERSAVRRDVMPVPLGDPSQKARLIRMAVGRFSSDYPAGLDVPSAAGAAVVLTAGDVANLNDARFQPETGTRGLWEPETALLAGHTGLYLNEPFDSSKIPVVFVHGIGGSPQDFKQLIPRLDRSRYQAWFFAYPSGFRLGKASTALASLLDLTMRRYDVEQVHIVAHSMGGLVSRDAIFKISELRGGRPVGRFISISTPWGGHGAAKSGLRHLRYPVPSWIDMAPGSAFLTGIWKNKLPCPHWLIFGFDTKPLPWLTLNNDTVVDLESTLYLPAQEQAVRVVGLKKDHESILFSPETALKMNGFLIAR